MFSERRACVPAAGPVNFSTSAQLVAPAVVVKGTLSITNCELYFEVDEDEPSFRAIDPKVGEGAGLHWSRLNLPLNVLQEGVTVKSNVLQQAHDACVVIHSY